MNLTWLDGLDDDQKKNVRADFKSALILRKRLKEILEDKIDTKRVAVRKDTNYDKPSWDNYVADSLGYERAMSEVISLLIDKEK